MPSLFFANKKQQAMISSCLLIVPVAFLCIYICRIIFTKRNLPPGPLGFPFVGVIPYVEARTAHLTFEKWCKHYGGLISFYMGKTLVVVLGNNEVVREALVQRGDVFNGRQVIRAFRAKNVSEGLGLTGAEGDLWREQRRFCLTALRDFGAGRSILEPKVLSEAQFLLDSVSQHRGQPFDIKHMLHYAISNIIVQFVFGHRFDYKDMEFIACLDKITFRLATSGVNGASTFNFLPWLLTVPPVLIDQSNAQKVIAEGSEILVFIRKCLDRKLAQCVPEEPTDYVSAFMKARRAGQGKHFHEDQLLIAVQQLLIAGGETTATTLRWALWYMCKYPHYQDKVYNEILEVTGTVMPCSWTDHSRMPFTEAVLCEVERIKTVFPFSVTHRTVDDTQLAGYDIPKDAYVIPLLWTVHRDPVHFPKPEEFKPERFLDEDNRLKTIPAFMPFGVGKRACLGESLAKMELFIFFTSLLKSFHFKFASVNYFNMDENDSTEVSVVISPKPFEMVATERIA